MKDEHVEAWPMIFSGWVQGVLDDERSNAFSVFEHDEIKRVFHNTGALIICTGILTAAPAILTAASASFRSRVIFPQSPDLHRLTTLVNI